MKRKEEKEEKDGWRPRAATARISERRVSRIPLSPPPYPPPVGGYRLTAIRLNLFHHKRLNKEVHSSARAAKPPLVTREIRPTCARLPLSASVHHLRSSIWISSFPVESFDERDSSPPIRAIVPHDFFAIQPQTPYLVAILGIESSRICDE